MINQVAIKYGYIQKPISIYSDDSTDFEFKKYIPTVKEYYLNGKVISEEEFKSWCIKNASSRKC